MQQGTVPNIGHWRQSPSGVDYRCRVMAHQRGQFEDQYGAYLNTSDAATTKHVGKLVAEYMQIQSASSYVPVQYAQGKTLIRQVLGQADGDSRQKFRDVLQKRLGEK